MFNEIISKLQSEHRQKEPDKDCVVVVPKVIEVSEPSQNIIKQTPKPVVVKKTNIKQDSDVVWL